MTDVVLNYIMREVERFHASRYTERHGLVTSYDPKKHLAKVAFQPEGTQSGWLPIETLHMGDGWGHLIGLTPGQDQSQQGGGGSGGNSSSSNGSSGNGQQDQGDQVIVRYQEGDFESGKIVKVVHSDKDVPPVVQAGEMLSQHKYGARIFWDQYGEIWILDKTNNGQGYQSSQSDEQAQQSEEQRQKAQQPQSVSLRLNGKANYTSVCYDQTNQPNKDKDTPKNGPTVQQAQQQMPPLGVAFAMDGKAGSGGIGTYRQGAPMGSASDGPPIPPMAAQAYYDCTGNATTTTWQDQGNTPGTKPPISTSVIADQNGNLTSTTYQQGMTSSAPVSTQVTADNEGDLTFTTNYPAVGTSAPVSTQVTLTGNGGMTLSTFQQGALSAQITLDNQGNITIQALQSGTIEIDNEGGKIEMKAQEFNVTAQKIGLDAVVYLGTKEGGQPAAKLGTVDTAGYADVQNLAQRVFVT